MTMLTIEGRFLIEKIIIDRKKKKNVHIIVKSIRYFSLRLGSVEFGYCKCIYLFVRIGRGAPGIYS